MGGLSTGYGTYAAMAAAGIASLAFTFGWIDRDTYEKVLGVIGPLGGVMLRAAVSASDAKNATANAVIATKQGVPAEEVKAKITDPAGVTPPATPGLRALG